MRQAALGLFVVFAGGIGACTPTKSQEDELKELAVSMPWMLEMLEICEAFKGAKAEADKREIARNAHNILARSTVRDLRGVVEILQPIDPEKPDELTLQIKVGDEVKFVSQSGERPIAKGSPIFEQAQTFTKGQCILFSAERLKATALFDQGRACIPRYFAVFTELKHCPEGA